MAWRNNLFLFYTIQQHELAHSCAPKILGLISVGLVPLVALCTIISGALLAITGPRAKVHVSN